MPILLNAFFIGLSAYIAGSYNVGTVPWFINMFAAIVNFLVVALYVTK